MNELSLLELFAQATLIVKIVVVRLIIASIITWLIIVERYLHFQESEEFNNEFETLFWNTKDLQKLFKSSSSKDASELIGLERVFYYSYKENIKLKDLKIDSQTKSENISRSIRIAISKEEGVHTKHLQYLANVGSVSPYIGLFGTVIGIVNAFQGLSDATQATINAVAPGISEALIATALGLFAAIPAVLAFNKFTVSIFTNLQNRKLMLMPQDLFGYDLLFFCVQNPGRIMS